MLEDDLVWSDVFFYVWPWACAVAGVAVVLGHAMVVRRCWIGRGKAVAVMSYGVVLFAGKIAVIVLSDPRWAGAAIVEGCEWGIAA